MPTPRPRKRRPRRPDAIALAREAAREGRGAAQERQGRASARRRQDRPHGGDRHPCARHADRRLQRRCRAMSSACSKACKPQRKGQFEVDYAEGVRLTEDRCWSYDEVKLIAAEVNAQADRGGGRDGAQDADVVVMVLGDNEQLSREAWADNHLGDRASLDLIGSRNELARAIFALGKPIVVHPAQRPAAVGQLSGRERTGADRGLVSRTGDRERGRRRAVRHGQSGRQAARVDRARRSASCRSIYNRKPTSRRGYLFDSTSSALSVRVRAQLHDFRRFSTAVRAGHGTYWRERPGQRRCDQHRHAARATRSCSSTCATTRLPSRGRCSS